MEHIGVGGEFEFGQAAFGGLGMLDGFEVLPIRPGDHRLAERRQAGAQRVELDASASGGRVCRYWSTAWAPLVPSLRAAPTRPVLASRDQPADENSPGTDWLVSGSKHSYVRPAMGKRGAGFLTKAFERTGRPKALIHPVADGEDDGIGRDNAESAQAAGFGFGAAEGQAGVFDLQAGHAALVVADDAVGRAQEFQAESGGRDGRLGAGRAARM